MKRFTLALVASLVLAAPAGAKELRSATVCGPSACATIDSTRDATVLAHLGPHAGKAAAPGPYYVASFTGDGDGEPAGWKAYYVPGDGLWASYDPVYGLVRWSRPDATAAGLIAAATEGLVPFPAPEIESARVGGRPVTGDPQSYLTLFTVGAAGRRATPPSTYDWVPVDLVASAATPWTASDRDLMFSPGAGAIERVGVRIPLSGRTAEALAAGETLAAADGGFAWATLALAFGGVALAIVLAVVSQRLAQAPKRRPSPV